MSVKLQFPLSWKPIAIISIVVAFLVAGSILYYNTEKNITRQEKINELQTISKFKIREIARWHDERLSEALFFPGEKTFIEYVKKLINRKNQTEINRYFSETLTPIKENHLYENFFITDINGKVLYSLDSLLDRTDSVSINGIQNAIREKKIVFTDFYYCSIHKKIHYDIISPIANENNNPIAVLVLRIDPNDYLYPFIQTWPVPSKTGESLIFRKEGNYVLFLNELKHQKNTALKLRLSLTRTDIVAIKAVIHGEGVIEGKDYRNVEVLGEVQRVPETSWYLVAKIDASEIYSGLQTTAILISFITILSILLISTGLAFVYKYRQGNIYKEMLLKEKNLSETQEEFRTTIYSIGDGVITTDKSGFVMRMNPEAEKLTGWNEKDARGKKLEKIFQIKNEETNQQIENPVQKILKNGMVVGLANHTLLISKDGTEIPIVDNGAPIVDENGDTIGTVLVFSDQTDEREAKKKLRESEARFSAVFHYSPIGIAISQISDGKFVDVNNTFLGMAGYNREEVIGLNGADLDLWVYSDVRDQFLNQIRTEGRIQQVETKFRKKSGETRYGKVTGEVIEFGGEKYLLSLVDDITGDKIREETLLESEAKNKALVNAIPDLIFLLSEDGIFLDYRASMNEKLMLPPERFLGKQIYEVLPPDVAIVTHQNLNKLFETRELQIFEYKLPSADKFKSFECRLVLSGEDKALAIVRDITIRKKAEESVRKLTRGIEQSPATILITDINANIEYVNPKFTEVTGYTFEEVRGLSTRILKSGNRSPKEYEEMWNTILNKKEWQGEFQNKKKNGDLYWERASISPILDEEGEITNFIAVKEDITELKRMMNELIEAKQNAEEMNRIKTYFYANMSHELRTPFVGIIGFAELLSEILEKPEEREMAEAILNASKRLTETLNKILNITNIEFGKLEVHKTGVDIFEMLERLRLLYSKAAEQQNTKIKTEFKCDPLLLRTDEKLLEEILNNLINNAVKFTSNGSINIITEVVERKDRDYLKITVSDTGVGIAKDKQEIIWKEFRQVSEGYGRSSEGTGLGLSIVKKYTELLNGKISVESEINKGAAFILELPLIVEIGDNRKEIPIDQTAVQEKQHRVLLVEDDIIARDLVKKILSNLYDIDVADKGETALEMTKKHTYSIMLIDINLGIGMNGVELMQKIREDDRHKSIPIIAVTAHATNYDRNEFLLKGFSHYISKPFSLKDLKKLLQEILI